MKTRLTFTLAIFLSLLLLLPSCGKGDEGEGALLRFSAYSFDYFDTVTTITGYAESREAFDLVANEVLFELREYHRLFTIYHRFEGLENLCTVNELTEGVHRTVTVDPRIVDMLLYAKQMHERTDGHVNIAMGSVLSIWHEYRTLGMKDPAKAELPPMDKLIEASAHTDIDCLVIDRERSTVTITDPRMTLDVGAIAKGYAVEMVARSMEEKGITGYVLNVGGGVRTVGPKADGNGWTVGIEDPLGGDDYVSYLSLSGQSLVTSGSYQRYYLVGGKRYHHIIDRDTLMPSSHFVSVSVLTKSSADGDALSTALFCMTLDEGMALINSLEGTEAQWILPNGTVCTSDGWIQSTVTP